MQQAQQQPNEDLEQAQKLPLCTVKVELELEYLHSTKYAVLISMNQQLLIIFALKNLHLQKTGAQRLQKLYFCMPVLL